MQFFFSSHFGSSFCFTFESSQVVFWDAEDGLVAVQETLQPSERFLAFLDVRRFCPSQNCHCRGVVGG